MDSKLKQRIIAALRKLTYGYKPRTDAKNAQKVGPAAYQCEHCQQVIYEGKKQDIPPIITDKYPNAIKGKIHLDHREPVVSAEHGWQGWDVYIERMFCSQDNYQAICSVCHKAKTFLEKQLRKENK